jgi:hypothetical protein
MYPNDAKTFFLNANANGTSGTLLSGASNIRTILNLGMSCNSGTNNSIIANGQQVAFIKNNSSVYKAVSFQIPANATVTYTKTNTADCFFTLVYVDYDLATMGTGQPAFFSGDGLFTSFLLLIGLIMALTAFVWKAISAIPVRREYTGVNSIEGKDHYEI